MKGDGSITHRGVDRWRLEFVHPRTKTRKTKTVRAKNRTEAKKALADFRDEILGHGKRDLEDVTLEEALEAYLESRHWKDLKSKGSTLSSLRVAVRGIGPKMALRDIDPQDLHRFQAERLEVVKATTVRRDLVALDFILRHGVQMGWITQNPMNHMVKCKKEKVEDLEWVKVHEFQEFMEAIRGMEPWETFYTLNWFQAWRKKTILDLRWEMIREVRGDYQAWLPTKSGYRAHVLHPKSVERLRALGWQEEGPVIKNRFKKGYSSNSFFTRGREFQARTGIKLLKSHAVRRGSATEMYLRGATEEQIMPVLGHTTVQQTQQYIRAVVARGHEAVGLL